MSAALIQCIEAAGRDFPEYGGIAALEVQIEGVGVMSGMVALTTPHDPDDILVHVMPFTYEQDRVTRQTKLVGFEETGWLFPAHRIIGFRYAELAPPLD